jgi:hypothetical protein
MTLMNDDPMLKRLDRLCAQRAYGKGITQKRVIQAISAYQPRNAAARNARDARRDLHVVTDNVSDLKPSSTAIRQQDISAETVGKLRRCQSYQCARYRCMAAGDELKAKIEAVPKTPDRTNTLPVPERKISLDLA